MNNNQNISTKIILLLVFLCGFNSFSQQCDIIYVTPGGASSGTAGTKANPANLTYGLTLIGPATSQIWMAAGTYNTSTQINMVSNVTLEGGFNPATWEKTNYMKTVINRDNTNVLPNPNRIVAISCNAISNFNINDITINVADAVGNAVTTYGIHVTSCSDYKITRVDVNAGSGSDGVDGVAGANGVNGANGVAGQNGDEDGACCTGGGAGGTGAYAGSNPGGNGGNGGQRGTGVCTFGTGGQAFPGAAGQTGAGTGGGTGGNGGQGVCQPVVSFGCDAGPASWGGVGVNGTNGADGANGADGTPGFGVFFIPGDGQNGVDGDNGGGGGGGGGGGSQGCLSTCFGNSNGAGPGGGGGGEGGQGGIGALGGTGGGGSFGIYISFNGTNGEVKDCFLNSKIPGIGGAGGVPGGNGGQGGQGGNGGGPGCDIGTGGDGGDGGKGGKGGNGGNGASGVSFPFYEEPSGISVAQSDMRSVVEPQVTVKLTGCTWSDVTYTTNAVGIIQWFFDGGAIPLTGTGQSVTMQYSTMGRHSVTLIVNGVPYFLTDFVGIFTDGSPYIPQIITADSVICPGGTGSFSSSYAGTSYEWKVYDSATPTVYTTATMSHTFPTQTGTYDVTLQTTSPCCGKSKIDTFKVQVVPVQQPNVYVIPSSTTICQGDSVAFGTLTAHGGYFPTFQWQVNGANVATGPIYSTSGLNNGDIVTVQMTSSYPCPANNIPTVTSLPITMTVNPNPVPVCNVTAAYLGANTAFSVTSSGQAPFTVNWDFGDGGIDTGMTATHVYGGTGQYTYSATVTDANGCTGTCTGTVDIQIPPLVFAGFDTTSYIQVCGGTTVSFKDTSIGGPTIFTWDFGDGSPVSNQQNPSHSYNQPGVYSVTLIASNGIFSDTVVYPNYVIVFGNPIADFNALSLQGCQPFGTQFTDKSLGSVSWQWNFGDPASGANNTSSSQNPYHIYNDTGYYSVTLTVYNTYGCSTTVSRTNYIRVIPAPEANFTVQKTTVCTNELVQFNDSSSSDVAYWQWDFGDYSAYSQDTNPVHAYSNPGFYSVTLIVESQNGCKDTIRKDSLIWVVISPDAIFTTNDTVLFMPDNEVKLTNLSQNYTSWLWDFGNGSKDSVKVHPVVYYTDSGTYYITLYAYYTQATATCVDSMQMIIRVVEQETLFIPNAFSPNGDNLNEVFQIKAIGITDYFLRIYNRWGDLIFESDSPDNSWDGRAGGKDCPDGVYIYRLRYKITNPDGDGFERKLIDKTGHVSILR